MIRRARCVVPGHGWPLAAARAQTILAEDRRYVDGLGAAAYRAACRDTRPIRPNRPKTPR